MYARAIGGMPNRVPNRFEEPRLSDAELRGVIVHDARAQEECKAKIKAQSKLMPQPRRSTKAAKSGKGDGDRCGEDSEISSQPDSRVRRGKQLSKEGRLEIGLCLQKLFYLYNKHGGKQQVVEKIAASLSSMQSRDNPEELMFPTVRSLSKSSSLCALLLVLVPLLSCYLLWCSYCPIMWLLPLLLLPYPSLRCA